MFIKNLLGCHTHSHTAIVWVPPNIFMIAFTHFYVFKFCDELKKCETPLLNGRMYGRSAIPTKKFQMNF